MPEPKTLHLLIVEDEDLAKNLVKDHFTKGVTYCEIIPYALRSAVIKAVAEAVDGTCERCLHPLSEHSDDDCGTCLECRIDRDDAAYDSMKENGL